MRLFSQEHIHCCCRTNRQVPPGGISTSGALCSHSSSPSLGEGCAWCLFASLPALLPSFPPITHNRLCAGWEPRAVSTLLTQTVAFLMADPVPPSHSPPRQDAQKEHSSSSQHAPSAAPGCLAGTTSIPVSSGWRGKALCALPGQLQPLSHLPAACTLCPLSALDRVPIGHSSTGHRAGHTCCPSQGCQKVLNTLQHKNEHWCKPPRGTTGGEHGAEKRSAGVTKQMSPGTAGHNKYLCLTVPSSAQKAGEQRYEMSYEGSCRTDFCNLWRSASHQERCDRAHARSHRGGDVSSFSLRNNNVK